MARGDIKAEGRLRSLAPSGSRSFSYDSTDETRTFTVPDDVAVLSLRLPLSSSTAAR
ncbi:hypothetical protein ACFYN3_28440 [Streptomyces lavendulae]|uniref:hypothetical protein n=1 Tax=Streptomyces lavendulae TaxID=1914 RepID=UPI0036900CD8